MDGEADFPGRFAGASLKQVSPEPAVSPVVNFPGRFAGASLKPNQLRFRSSSALRHFPGRFAGASLKPSSGDTDMTDYNDFPGRFAGASLKRSGSADSLEARTASPPITKAPSFPRQIRRGLIEACLPMYRKGWSAIFPRQIRRGLIEADSHLADQSDHLSLFPRQIRRGLIEAAFSLATMASRSSYFPGRFAGASLKHPQAVAGDTKLPGGRRHEPGET